MQLNFHVTSRGFHILKLFRFAASRAFACHPAQIWSFLSTFLHALSNKILMLTILIEVETYAVVCLTLLPDGVNYRANTPTCI